MPKDAVHNWISGAVHPENKGALHRALHVAVSKQIPGKKLAKALHSKNSHLRHEAQFAENMRHLNKKH